MDELQFFMQLCCNLNDIECGVEMREFIDKKVVCSLTIAAGDICVLKRRVLYL